MRGLSRATQNALRGMTGFQRGQARAILASNRGGSGGGSRRASSAARSRTSAS